MPSMIQPIINNLHRHRYLLYIVALSCTLSVSLAFFRFYLANSILFGFLLWNLFLAAIPMGFAMVFSAFDKHAARWKMLIVLSLWLLFFPNAPYIITDLVHLYPRRGVPFWYDLVLIFTFAWNGLMLGYVSLLFIQQKIEELYSRTLAWAFAIGSMSLGAFGIYLGRFDRWNSWDIFQEPLPLLRDIASYFMHPRTHIQTWGITCIIAAFLITGYLVIKQLTLLQRRMNSEQ